MGYRDQFRTASTHIVLHFSFFSAMLSPPPSLTFPLLLLLLLLQLVGMAHPSLCLPFAVPPGNSIAINSTVSNGYQVYRCNARGAWQPSYRSATLRNAKNESIILGTYVNYYVPKYHQLNAGIWTLVNSAADRSESGHVSSIVAGKRLVETNDNDMGDFLAQASWHKYLGTTSKISYIAQLNGTLLSPLPSLPCGVENTTLERRFSANYIFWTQDALPPPVPKSLSVADRPVEAFFGQGVVRYVFDGRLWIKRRMIARLYDVPGGVRTGGITSNLVPPNINKSANTTICINDDEPNGLRVCGVQNATPVIVSPSSLPWSRFLVTNNSGTMAKILGPFSFIHIISTRAGLSPTGVNVTINQVWKSPFTAIIWIYTNRGT